MSRTFAFTPTALFGVLIVLTLVAVPTEAQEHWFVQAQHSGKCLHQHGGVLGNGRSITQWDCVDLPHVKIQRVPTPDGYLFLKFVHSGQCVHQEGHTSGNGDRISQWDCADLDNIKILEVDAEDEHVYLQFKHSRKCVHQHGGVKMNGARISQWDCVNLPHLKWKFVPASPAPRRAANKLAPHCLPPSAAPADHLERAKADANYAGCFETLSVEQARGCEAPIDGDRAKVRVYLGCLKKVECDQACGGRAAAFHDLAAMTRHYAQAVTRCRETQHPQHCAEVQAVEDRMRLAATRLVGFSPQRTF